MMHIHLLAPNVELSSNNAQTVHLFELANALTNMGNAVTLYALSAQDDRNPDLPEGVSFSPTFSYSFPLGQVFRELKLIRSIVSNLDPSNKNIVYIRQYLLSFLPSFIAKLFKIPVMIEVNGMYQDDKKLSGSYPNIILKTRLLFTLVSYLEKLLLILNFRLARRVTVVAPGLIQYLHENYHVAKEEIDYCQNGTNLELFTNINKKKYRDQLKLKQDKTIIGFFGTLRKWQGIDYFLDAFAAISEKYQNVDLIIGGSGELERKLKSRVNNSEIDDRVTFTGSLHHEEVIPYIGAVDIGIAPYSVSKWPRNLIMGVSGIKIPEGLAAANLIIASRLPGLEFVEDEKLGFLAEPDDIDDWVRVLDHVLSIEQDELDSITTRARRYAHENFSWSRTAQCVYQSMAKCWS